jgi:hypothetical protein
MIDKLSSASAFKAAFDAALKEKIAAVLIPSRETEVAVDTTEEE